MHIYRGAFHEFYGKDADVLTRLLFGSYKTVSGPSGEYAIEGVKRTDAQPGRFRIRAIHGGEMSPEKQFIEGDHTFDLAIGPTGRIEGNLVDIQAVVVIARHATDRDMMTFAKVSPDRTFRFDHHGRIRGLQNHRRKVERAWPRARTAVNISGIAASQLQRGQVLIHPGQYASTRRVDAHLRLLHGASTGVAHNHEVKVFLGTAESTAVLRLLNADEIHSGTEGLIQLEFSHELVCARGDRFILRRPSPPETLGGGDILNAHPPGRHRRFDAQTIASLRAQGSGQAAELLYEVIQTIGYPLG